MTRLAVSSAKYIFPWNTISDSIVSNSTITGRDLCRRCPQAIPGSFTLPKALGVSSSGRDYVRRNRRQRLRSTFRAPLFPGQSPVKICRGVVGYYQLYNESNTNTISNSTSAANVTATSGGVGGLVGHLQSGTVVNASATGNVSGLKYVGGLIGNMASANTKVSKSYATGNVTRERRLRRGLIGNLSKGLIDQVYATGDVSNNTQRLREHRWPRLGRMITERLRTHMPRSNTGYLQRRGSRRNQYRLNLGCLCNGRRRGHQGVGGLVGKTIKVIIPAGFRSPMRADM